MIMSTMNLCEELYVESTTEVCKLESPIKHKLTKDTRTLILDMIEFFETPSIITKTYPTSVENLSKVTYYDKSYPYITITGGRFAKFLDDILKKGYYGEDSKVVLNRIREFYIKGINESI